MGSVFLYGFYVPLGMTRVVKTGAAFAPNAFIRLDSGAVTLIIPQVEIGQGTYTSLSTVLAEELDADWSRVQVEHAGRASKRIAQTFSRAIQTGCRTVSLSGGMQ